MHLMSMGRLKGLKQKYEASVKHFTNYSVKKNFLDELPMLAEFPYLPGILA